MSTIRFFAFFLGDRPFVNVCERERCILRDRKLRKDRRRWISVEQRTHNDPSHPEEDDDSEDVDHDSREDSVPGTEEDTLGHYQVPGMDQNQW